MNREEARREMMFAKSEVMADSWIDRAYDMAIKALEQEPCGDAVSREAVIKIVDRHTDDDGRLDDDISCILEEVPLVKPVSPKCDNAISRSAVISVIKRSDIFSTYTELDDIDDIVADVIDEARKQLVDNVDALPSVTPKQKTGNWIEDGYYNIPCACSYCGTEGKRKWKYCPNCGSKNGGINERIE